VLKSKQSQIHRQNITDMWLGYPVSQCINGSVEVGVGDDLNGDGLGAVDSDSCCLFGSSLP